MVDTEEAQIEQERKLLNGVERGVEDVESKRVCGAGEE
jgi:hypothetical protein